MTRNLADIIREQQEEEAQQERDWSGDYDGTTCPNCNRQRMLLCNNGRRRCEKCNWDPDEKCYSDAPLR